MDMYITVLMIVKITIYAVVYIPLFPVIPYLYYYFIHVISIYTYLNTSLCSIAITYLLIISLHTIRQMDTIALARYLYT